ncbi:TspO/MBR related protein [Novosphingobium kunmingense]|uniref:TspO/MBR related protein n=1 Tax=Novosphingobium kunmingense TaxID=1211806 RepID=A0A2N0I3W5_9SPHN|nr:TspO/MBR family protein [Novosphingobium kunmingense]PKB25884.1 TspO/MBR related protein [Novosphingobium kunmingense]
MTELASRAQLRASFLRWAVALVPVVVLLGLLSGRIANSGPGNAWFDALAKPSLYPPPALFGIVWTVLYILMGLALAMVVTSRGAPGRGLAIAAFVVQLLLNLAWSPVFFGMGRLVEALYLLVAIDFAVLVTLVLFWRVRPIAGVLLLPYLGWVLFATALNWQFVEANPGASKGEASTVTVDLQ